jgi:hypothetical protein
MTMSKFFWIPPARAKLAGTSCAGITPLTGSFPRRQKACFFEDFLDHSTNMKSPPKAMPLHWGETEEKARSSRVISRRLLSLRLHCLSIMAWGVFDSGVCSDFIPVP